MSLGVLDKHVCNAWCNGDVHVRLMYTPDNPPMWLHPGTTWILNNREVIVIKVEPASPEANPVPGRPEGYDFGWLVWCRYT